MKYLLMLIVLTVAGCAHNSSPTASPTFDDLLYVERCFHARFTYEEAAEVCRGEVLVSTDEEIDIACGLVRSYFDQCPGLQTLQSRSITTN